MLPTYSCQLNPIETYWSLLKRKWRQNMYQITEELAAINDNKTVQKRAVDKLHLIIGK